jgi:AcrR family transcriptional regulator
MGIIERKEREKEHRKEEILDAAQRIFFDKGLASATMDDIADAAELSKGTLYLYYKSKEDMYLAVAMRGMNSMKAQIDVLIETEPTIVGVLAQLPDVAIQFYLSNKNYFRMFSFLHMPQFHKQVSPEVEMAGLDESQKSRNAANKLLERAVQDGLIREDIPPVDLVVIIFSNIISMINRHDVEGEFLREKCNIDILKTLKLAHMLFLSAILTEKGRAQLEAIEMPQLLN